MKAVEVVAVMKAVEAVVVMKEEVVGAEVTWAEVEVRVAFIKIVQF